MSRRHPKSETSSTGSSGDSNLAVYLDTVYQLSQTAAADDLWLETVQRLSSPFAQLDEIPEKRQDEIGVCIGWPFGKDEAETAVEIQQGER